MKGKEPVRGPLAGPLAALGYAVTSVAIMLFNKGILKSYRFNYPCLMVLTHQISCILFLKGMELGNVVELPTMDLVKAKKVLPLASLNAANVVISQLALRAVSVPMFTTLRRLTVLFVMVTQYLVNGVRPSVQVVIAVSVMMLGAAIGGYGDLGFDLAGYVWTFANNVLTALYLSYIKKVEREVNLGGGGESNVGIVYYNSVLSCPLLFLASLGFGELSAVWDYPYLWDSTFQGLYILSALFAFGVTFFTFLSTTVNSPLTTSVTGQAKNVITTLLSIAVFGLEGATSVTLFGLFVGLSGGGYYAYSKYQEQQQQRKASQHPASSSQKAVPEAVPLTSPVKPPNTMA